MPSVVELKHICVQNLLPQRCASSIELEAPCRVLTATMQNRAQQPAEEDTLTAFSMGRQGFLTLDDSRVTELPAVRDTV